jgi:protocatechuate 3,4-dioxygenase beta subunit
MNEMTRRRVLGIGSVLVANGTLGGLEVFLTACGGSAIATTSSSSSTASADVSSCGEATNVTRGPYFIDDRADSNISNDVIDKNIPERSDITTDTEGSAGAQAGLPLTLNIYVGTYDSGTSSCAVLSGAQVHIWHCNAQGDYSDVTTHASENFLRGYQFTDADGKVGFTTIYPGWYRGRAVHIHVKVRVFDSSGAVTTEATTQLFFDEATTSAVYAANSAYSRSTARDTLNTADSIYAQEDPALLVSLSGSSTSGYTGTVSIGIIKGVIYGG